MTAPADVKERMIAIIDRQPEDSSYEEILRELAFARMVDRGLADSDGGRTISNEQMGSFMRLWISSGTSADEHTQARFSDRP